MNPIRKAVSNFSRLFQIEEHLAEIARLPDGFAETGSIA